MNQIDLTNLGGFPLEQDTLAFMQDAYGDLFSAVAGLVGSKTILAGVVVAGGNVSDGWIAFNGELLRFVGGAVGAGVVVSEVTAPATFEDGTTKAVYKIRVATIGTPATFAFSDLKRFSLPQIGYDASDNPDENDPLKLATTVATKTLADRILVLGSGIYDVGDVGTGDPFWTVNHGLNIQVPYMVIGSWQAISGYATNNKMPAPVFFNRTPNTFQFSVQEITAENQSIALAYILVKI